MLLVPGLICIKESCIFLKQPMVLLIFTFTISLISFVKIISGEASHFSSPQSSVQAPSSENYKYIK